MRYYRLILILICTAVLSLPAGDLLAAAPAQSAAAEPQQHSARPNIVWIMAEDISLELECYGHPAVKTPNLNKLAEEGARYTHAFGTSPSCSPNRSAKMLGVYQTRVDAQDHRRRTTRPLPKGMKPFTQWLKDAGYYTAIGCGYNAKNDLNFPAKDVFEGNDWKHRAQGQPFFAQITLYVTHRDPKKRWHDVRAQSKHPVDPDGRGPAAVLPRHPRVPDGLGDVPGLDREDG